MLVPVLPSYPNESSPAVIQFEEDLTGTVSAAFYVVVRCLSGTGNHCSSFAVCGV